ncbi:MAG: DUF3027 domain-containing protein [Frankiaceae bacterium]
MALSRTSSSRTSPAAAATAGQSGLPPARRTRPPTLDEVCAAAVEFARRAAIEEAGDESMIGEHLGVEAEAERLVLHRFQCLSSAYVGWEWAVTVTRAARAKVATVDDATLLPGPGALVAPAWVPWSERLRPGDLGVGDLLPTAAADPRLALRAADVERLSDEELFIELGLGRSRVLSFDGRFDAAERWLAGEPGPESALARAAPARCRTCGFHVRLVGALGRMFGVCANEFAPDDSRVTAFDHGCGAHSEALVLPSVQPQPVRLDDDTEVELVTPKTSDGTRTEVPAGASGEAPDEDAAGEAYGHS